MYFHGPPRPSSVVCPTKRTLKPTPSNSLFSVISSDSNNEGKPSAGRDVRRRLPVITCAFRGAIKRLDCKVHIISQQQKYGKTRFYKAQFIPLCAENSLDNNRSPPSEFSPKQIEHLPFTETIYVLMRHHHICSCLSPEESTNPGLASMLQIISLPADLGASVH